MTALFGLAMVIIGSTITLDEVPHTVVGIAPSGFKFGSRPVDLWIPWAFDNRDMEGRGRHFLEVVARLKPGVEIDAAREELENISTVLGRTYPECLNS